MKLDEWLRTSGTKPADLAETLGLTEASVSRVRRGLQTPSLELAVKIEDATGGAVTCSELLPTPAEAA